MEQNKMLELTPQRELEIGKRTWKFFLNAHPDADMDAVVDVIVDTTREITLREVRQEMGR